MKDLKYLWPVQIEILKLIKNPTLSRLAWETTKLSKTKRACDFEIESDFNLTLRCAKENSLDINATTLKWHLLDMFINNFVIINNWRRDLIISDFGIKENGSQPRWDKLIRRKFCKITLTEKTETMLKTCL